MAKDYLQEAQDKLKEGIGAYLSQKAVGEDEITKIESMTKSLLNIVQYIKINREVIREIAEEEGRY
ncbi:MAG: hypothetical protein GY861_12630 [bacterium]|nr:hypothetical protein [bacterium]